MIVLLVVSCARYLSRLDRWKDWENRHQTELARNDIEIAYVIGRPCEPSLATAPGWSNLHALDVGDEYEDLPEKVLLAFQWVRETYDRIEGVFKTDDDIVFDVSILNYIRLLGWVPYWALQNGHIFHQQIHDHVYARASRPLEVKALEKCVHALGRGYYVNQHCIEILTEDIAASTALSYHEDYLVGLLLNRHNIFPVDFGFLLAPHYRLPG